MKHLVHKGSIWYSYLTGTSWVVSYDDRPNTDAGNGYLVVTLWSTES